MCHIQCVPSENCAQANKSSCLNPRDNVKITDDSNRPYEISRLFSLYAMYEIISIDNNAMRYDDISLMPK